MNFEKELTVIKDNKKEVYCYYVKKQSESEFDKVMYTVGIKSGNKIREIRDFSSSYERARELCKYLHDRHVSIEILFSVAEEFIVRE